jgi:hypothetical protein
MTCVQIKYHGTNVFDYDPSQDTLTCPFCQRIYLPNHSKIQNILHSDKIRSDDVIICRCIECELSPDVAYPLRLGTFAPNEEQSSAIRILYQQLLITENVAAEPDEERYLFLINGVAGTGKTSTVMYLFQFPEFAIFDIVFASPTNKALNVMVDKLSSSSPDEDPDTDTDLMGADTETSRKFKTIFKLTGSSTEIALTGETKFIRNQDATTMKLSHDIIVIDESSMIDKNQAQILLSVAQQMIKTSLIKTPPFFIFLGDVGQLPPVGEEASTLFSEGLQVQYRIKVITLQRIMRSAHCDPLTHFSNRLRRLVDGSTDEPYIDLRKIASESNQSIHYHADRQQWLDSYTKAFKLAQKADEVPIILVYTNMECDSLNESCRNNLFDHPKDPYVPGELLVFKSYYQVRRQKVAPQSGAKSSYCIKFFTSDPYLVDQVIEDTYQIPPFTFIGYTIELGIRLPNWVKGGVPIGQEETVVSQMTALMRRWTYDPNGVLRTHNLTINAQLSQLVTALRKLKHHYQIVRLLSKSTKLDPHDAARADLPEGGDLLLPIMAINRDSMEQYTTNCDQMKLVLRTAYKHLNRMTCLTDRLFVDFLFRLLWREYYRVYVWPFANVAYGYCITTHKSQGSTYRQTFINISNILGCQKVSPVVKSKSLYTAITRASHGVSVFSKTPLLTPIVTESDLIECQLCRKRLAATMYSPVNRLMDKACADKHLGRVQPMTVIERDMIIYLVDKYKNVYPINRTDLAEVHINDAYDYIIQRNLRRSEIDRYLASNIKTIMEIHTK